MAWVLVFFLSVALVRANGDVDHFIQSQAFQYAETETCKSGSDMCYNGNGGDDVQGDCCTGMVCIQKLHHMGRCEIRTAEGQLLNMWRTGELRNITELDISPYGLKGGRIPEVLGHCTWVTSVDLSSLALDGPIPSSFANLVNLRTLDLSKNSLSGPIPAWLANLSQLRTLALSSNAFSGAIPQELTALGKLQHLHLDSNLLSGPLPDLAALQSLVTFSVNENFLNGEVPQSLAKLGSLTQLLLGSNVFSGEVPPALGELRLLRKLDLSRNFLTGPLHSSLGGLRQLEELLLCHNQLSGTIPATLGEMESLLTLDLSVNQMAGPLPQELGKLHQLRTMSLAGNKLSGVVPGDLGNLSSLLVLELQNNELTRLSPELGRLRNLTGLRADHNQLEGNFPTELAGLHLLQELILSWNNLQGPLPLELRNLTKLERLELQHNSFSGEIPDLFDSMTALQVLNLGHNQFSGLPPRSLYPQPVGESYYDMPFFPAQLRVLILSNNQLSGSLWDVKPSWWAYGEIAHGGAWSALEVLDVAGNKDLRGPFVRTDYALNLATVRAGGCNFSSLHAQSSNIRHLDLSGNPLGEVPDEVLKLQLLEELDLSDCNISQWPLRGVPRLPCSRDVREPPFPWTALTKLVVSRNPLRMKVQLFVDSLSYLPRLRSLEARACGLESVIEDFDIHKEEATCNAAWRPWMGFTALHVLDMGQNQIRGIRADPPAHLRIGKLDYNDLTDLVDAWWTQNSTKYLAGNEKLAWPVGRQESAGCPSWGARSTPLQVDMSKFSFVLGTAHECTHLENVYVDGWTFNQSGMCRCLPGYGGSGTNCSLCPANHFSQWKNGCNMEAVCPKCGPYQVSDVGSSSALDCKCDPSIRGLIQQGRVCRCQQENHYVDLTWKACRACPAARDSDGRSGKDHCRAGLPSYALLAGIVALVTLSISFLPMALGCLPSVIEDVSLKNEKLRVTTTLSHHCLRWVRWHMPVRLYCTGHPGLDTPQKPLKVLVADRNHLWLCRGSQEPLDVDMGTSMGFVRVCFPHALLCLGFAGVPFILWAAAFEAVALLLSSLFFLPLLAIAAAHFLASCLALVLHASWWFWASSTTLRARHRRFLQALHLELPQPVRVPSGSGRAISAKQLSDFFHDFRDLIRDRNMYYIDSNLVRPLTARQKVSFAELVGPKEVTWFVSHYWGSPFQHFISSILQHAHTFPDWQSQTFWVCTFSNNQWSIGEELGEGKWWQSSFYKALQSSSCCGTLMIFDQKATPLTRVWCLFEVFTTMRLTGSQRPGFQGLLLGTETGVLNRGHGSMDVALSLAQRLSTLDLRNAEASNPDDLVLIHGLVEGMGGFDMVNGFVRTAIKDAMEVMYTAFNESVQVVMRTLGESQGSALNAKEEPEMPHEEMDVEEKPGNALEEPRHKGLKLPWLSLLEGAVLLLIAGTAFIAGRTVLTFE